MNSEWPNMERMYCFLGINERIARLEDMRNQRLEFLRRYEKETYNAIMWLRENQDKFEHPIHEPIMLMVR